MAAHHPSDNDEHPHRPEWWNGISLGNVLTIGGGVVVAAIAWGANDQKQMSQDVRINKVEQSVEQLRDKAEAMAINQAAMLANVEMLVRDRGLQPIKPSEVPK